MFKFSPKLAEAHQLKLAELEVVCPSRTDEERADNSYKAMRFLADNHPEVFDRTNSADRYAMGH